MKVLKKILLPVNHVFELNCELTAGMFSISMSASHPAVRDRPFFYNDFDSIAIFFAGSVTPLNLLAIRRAQGGSSAAHGKEDTAKVIFLS
ncbi:hypothetical protein [Virgibacillus siamensis]|uniref:hypothetical protein n=1 Tax=Virgibacillus siamensis TaxID=480071 RepID=UPI0031CFAA16